VNSLSALLLHYWRCYFTIGVVNSLSALFTIGVVYYRCCCCCCCCCCCLFLLLFVVTVVVAVVVVVVVVVFVVVVVYCRYGYYCYLLMWAGY